MSGAVLLVAALCGIGFGYAAQRGSICVVRGLEEWLQRGSPRMLTALFRCSLWVVVAAVPLVWLDRDAHLAPLYAPGLAALMGGLMFGVGAAINGGCSFGTLIRLGAGDLSCLGTLAGMAAGFWAQLRLGPPAPGPIARSFLESPSLPGALLVAAALALALRAPGPAAASPPRPGRWSPERAAALMGLTGGLLYALTGSWAYTVALQRSVDAMADGRAIALTLLPIFLANVLGAAWGAGRRQRLRVRINARRWPARLAGGAVMGAGAAYVPGGNDALVLHALPALSPHVLIAYPALIAGAAAALGLARRARAMAGMD